MTFFKSLRQNMGFLQKYACFIGLFVFLFCSSCKEEQVNLHPHERKIKLGDQMEWADPEFDDSDWDPSGSTHKVGNFWVRFHVDFDERIELLNNKGAHMISLGSFAAYWDGILVYENGQVGTSKENEVEGQFISQMLIPDSLCQQGSHVLALRISNFRNNPLNSWSWNSFVVEEFNSSIKKELQITAIMFILGGCFLLVSIYYFLLFVKEDRDLATLVFSLMCFLFFGLLLIEYLKFYWAYPYSFHNLRLKTIGTLTAIIAFVVPTFLCLHLDIPKRKFFLGSLVSLILLTVISFNIKFDTTAQFWSQIMLYSSIIIAAYACWLKRKGSQLILTAFLIVAAINYFSNFNVHFLIYSYDINLFFSFLILVITILYSLSQQRKDQQEAYEASLLHSERLKNELLRKNIQPHFIMNTLTSIMEWVERSPKKSIDFIEALAGEFDLLNDIADEKLIPISEEINLCKKHLEIMTFRKELIYTWEDENINSKIMIPPAILHTIVENGITHSQALDKGQIKFKLMQEDKADFVVLSLDVFAKNRKNKSSGSGTGFKYIKSRLTESFGNKWTLSSEETDFGWRTKISIPKL